MNTMTDDIRVMTSGAFTAAYLELIPRLELLTKKKLVTAATSIGTGETSIPNRLRRGEPVDVVIVADGVLVGFIKDGLIMAESYTPVARSAIGMAVRAGAPKPDISTVDALKRTLLQAKSIAYSASVSGDYVSTELLQRLGIADQVMSKSRRIEGGERVGAVVARGEAEIGFQQIERAASRARHRSRDTAAAGSAESLCVLGRRRPEYQGFGRGSRADQVPRLAGSGPRHHK